MGLAQRGADVLEERERAVAVTRLDGVAQQRQPHLGESEALRDGVVDLGGHQLPLLRQRGAQVLLLQAVLFQRQAEQLAHRTQQRQHRRRGLGALVEEQVVDPQHALAMAQGNGDRATASAAEEGVARARGARLQFVGPHQPAFVDAAAAEAAVPIDQLFGVQQARGQTDRAHELEARAVGREHAHRAGTRLRHLDQRLEDAAQQRAQVLPGGEVGGDFREQSGVRRAGRGWRVVQGRSLPGGNP